MTNFSQAATQYGVGTLVTASLLLESPSPRFSVVVSPPRVADHSSRGSHQQSFTGELVGMTTAGYPVLPTTLLTLLGWTTMRLAIPELSPVVAGAWTR